MKAVTTCLTVLAMLLALGACGGGADDSGPGSGGTAPDGGTPAVSAATITLQPTAQTVTAPGVATFSVTASGTAPLSYQWRSIFAHVLMADAVFAEVRGDMAAAERELDEAATRFELAAGPLI